MLESEKVRIWHYEAGNEQSRRAAEQAAIGNQSMTNVLIPRQNDIFASEEIVVHRVMEVSPVKPDHPVHWCNKTGSVACGVPYKGIEVAEDPGLATCSECLASVCEIKPDVIV